MEQPKHIDMRTTDGSQLNLDALYQIAPSCFTEALGDDGELHRVIDFNKLRLLLGDNAVDDAPEVYDFTWVGKRAALKESSAPITKTLRPCPEESVNWDTTQNLYIEGDNLEVLKLLQNSYMGKVKMIYIDPPYNTGNDFVYHDDFAQSVEEYDEANRDEEGNRYRKNTDSNGRFHSDWCSMIYTRLMVARSLLTEEGVIFISIDDNEVENLRKICDEVFGESNFVSQLIWQRAFAPKNDAKYVSNSHDYVLLYAKSIENYVIGRLERTAEANARYSNPDNDPRGVWTSGDISVKTYSATTDYPITLPSGRTVYPPSGGCWRLSKETFEEYVHENRIWFGPNGDNTPRIKRFLSELRFEGMAPTSILFYKEVGHSQEGAKEVVALLDKGVFDGPKPVRLLKRLMTLANLKKSSIVLDFFSGSASTAHALLSYNVENEKLCNFILIQLPEKTDEKAYKAGYKNICEIGKERIRRAGKKILEEQQKKQVEEGLFAGASTPSTGSGADNLDIGFRVFKCEDSNYKEVSLAPKDYDQSQLEAFVDNIKDDRTDLDLLFDCMLRWGVELSLPLATTTVDGCTIHNVNNGDLVACFDGKVTEAVIEAIAQCSPVRVVFRDSSFTEAAQKMNLFELFKQYCDWTDEEVRNNVRVI